MTESTFEQRQRKYSVDPATRAHLLDSQYDEPELLRTHIGDAHPVYVVACRFADHQELDAMHIEAHR